MKRAKKQQCVLDALTELRDFVWVEDLYFMLLAKGESIRAATIYGIVRNLQRENALLLQIDGRRTLVALRSNKIASVN